MSTDSFTIVKRILRSSVLCNRYLFYYRISLIKQIFLPFLKPRLTVYVISSKMMSTDFLTSSCVMCEDDALSTFSCVSLDLRSTVQIGALTTPFSCRLLASCINTSIAMSALLRTRWVIGAIMLECSSAAPTWTTWNKEPAELDSWK